MKPILLLALLAAVACSGKQAEQELSRQAEAFGRIDERRLLAGEAGAWLTLGRDFQQSYYSPLKDIDRESVLDLGFVWQYDIDTQHGFEATPIVVDGTMYASGPRGAVYALDASSGRELWTFQPEIDSDVLRKVCCGIVNRGVAVWRGRVYVGSLDGYLIALDAQSGEVVWRVDTIIDRSRGYTITGAPYIANGLVVIGNSGAEYDARGYITAYDSATGRQAWRFFTVPGDPAAGFEHPELQWAAQTWDPDSLWEVGLGGTVWDAMAYDPDLNLLYVGTGNATPYPRKLRSPNGGDNLFISCILAIDPDDGSLVWHYQTTPADNWDYTATQKMILADLEIEGASRKVIMQAPKNGFFYVLDRTSGELISTAPFVAINWASHVDTASGRPVETGQGEYFAEAKLVFPSPAGGHNWQPMSFNPETGLVYIPAIEMGAVFAMPEGGFTYERGAINSAALYYFPTPGEWGLDGELAKRLPPLAELAQGQPDPTVRGWLRAWDPARQKLAWQVDTSGPWAGEMFAVWNGGGVMSSAGGLVFQGTGAGDLTIYDAATGQRLHQIPVGTSMMAAPITYSLDGVQYVAIMAGVGGAGGQSHPPGSAAFKYGNRGRIVAFRLGGGPVPLPPLVGVAGDSMQQPPVQRRGTPEEVQHGARLFERFCLKCHANTHAAGIPDLRHLSEAAHADFAETVLQGTLAERGMGAFADVLTAEEVEAIQTYLIDRSWQEWETSGSTPHRQE